MHICVVYQAFVGKQTAEEDPKEKVTLGICVGLVDSVHAPVVDVVTKNACADNRRQANYTQKPPCGKPLHPKAL